MASDRPRKAGNKDKSGPSTASVRAVSRSVGPTPKRVDDLFGGGDTGRLLQGRFHTDNVYQWFQKRHKRGGMIVESDGFYRRNGHEWRVPVGVREALRQPLRASQVGTQFPWYVTWRARDGRRLKKSFNSLAQAIKFTAEKAQYVDRSACIVSRHGYDIPARLRNKIPKPWKWCPGCMKPRKYRRLYNRHGDPQTFYGSYKVKKTDKSGYDYWETQDRLLALMRCPVCGWTNRDTRFRRSNQPFHVVKVKRGKTRIKGRRRG